MASVTLGELSEAAAPAGDTAEVRLMGPVKPLRLVRVIVEVPDDPVGMSRVTGFAEILKSAVGTTVTVMVTEWIREPLIPVTFTKYAPGGVNVFAVMVRPDSSVPAGRS